jgi:iron complex outermembrane receptor protein
MRRGVGPLAGRNRPLAPALLLAGSALAAPLAGAQVPAELPAVTVWADRLGTEVGSVLAAATVDGAELASRRARESDGARLLDGIAGLSFQGGGGVSSLPAIDGLADDRLRILVDGVPITASCPNHMNPSLSYAAPASVAHASVVSGVTPVSLGGDSIGGTIAVRSADPEFAAAGAGLVTAGAVSLFSRSAGAASGGDAHLRVASERLSLAYTGSSAQSGDYRDGSGAVVRSTEFKARNDQLTLARRFGSQLIMLSVSWQDIPYQAFANQYMDMRSNTSLALSVQYRGALDWGGLEARLYRRHVWHAMDALADKAELGVLTTGLPYTMPVDANGVDAGIAVQADVRASARDTLRLGAEYHRYTLTDWWPAIAGSMMNGPNAFVDINDGRRGRLAGFVEWDAKWTGRLSSQLGARFERVSMNTGPVQGYFSTGESAFGMGLSDGSVYQADANRFNAREHARVDDNLDATAALRVDADATATYEIGLAQKTRSPNLYERYAWSNAAGMAGTMISWFGDLNAYVGNLDLKPEVARTLRANSDWHDRERSRWRVAVAPFYTRVHDYIDAEPNSNITWPAPAGRVALRFANHAAILYGIDVSGQVLLGQAGGQWIGRAIASVVRGHDPDSGDDLYNLMPPNARLTLEHRLGSWSSGLELQLVAAKTRVDSIRQELPTAGYSLVGLGTRYEWRALALSVRIDNLLGKLYALPLGGIDFYTYNNLATAADRVAPVPGVGRSVNLGLTARF